MFEVVIECGLCGGRATVQVRKIEAALMMDDGEMYLVPHIPDSERVKHKCKDT